VEAPCEAAAAEAADAGEAAQHSRPRLIPTAASGLAIREARAGNVITPPIS
jgi:hypothetical protein